MLGVKLSADLQNFQKNLAALTDPAVLAKASVGEMEMAAIDLVHEFRDGIYKNNLGLVNLADITIEEKTRRGLTKPRTPLYGEGYNKAKSYIQMLRVRAFAKSVTIRPSKAIHHEAGIPLDALWVIHEFGCVITRKDGRTVRIPARPALNIAYERWQRKHTPRKAGKLACRYVRQYLKRGDWKKMENELAKARKEIYVSGD